ncbi:hypothetical protein [Streptomyces sp. CAU 1734]|uniref:hypothetical protein n=1 Tax=Streptomyces sp. CAU 1734 TaxID=3140360 RepID=UPI00326044A2
MPTPADQIPGGLTGLARTVADLKRQLAELRASRRATATAIGSGGITVQSTPDGPKIVLAAEGAIPEAGGTPPAVMVYSGSEAETTPGGLTIYVTDGVLGTVPGLLLVTPDLGYDTASVQLTGGASDDDAPSAELRAGRSFFSVDHGTGTATLWLDSAMTGVDFDAAGARPSAETWTALPLNNGWTSYGSSFQPPVYQRQIDGTVQLAGLIAPGTLTAGTTVATLPAGYRPTADHIYRVSAGAATAVADIYVRSSGALTIQNTAGTVVWLSLSTIRFPLI